MLPIDLHAEQFAGYTPGARKLVLGSLPALQQLPLSLVAGLLREVIDYDSKFPAERTAVANELAYLNSLSSAEIKQGCAGFARIRLSASLEELDWVNKPGQFLEQEAAFLWSTQQMDTFHKAATEYGNRLETATPAQPLPVPRLGIAVIGESLVPGPGALFSKLRAHGTYFSRVQPQGGMAALLAAVANRAHAHPVPYAHWYVDGGQAAEHSASLTCVGYSALEPMRTALMKRMQTEIAKPGMGPEELRTDMAQLMPSDLGLRATDPVMDRFQVRLLTEGSGTQIFSTTFVQWTAREALRRAQPLTLLVRFAPRQKARPMNELLGGTDTPSELDLQGSYVDAEMGTYYHWINQQRLPGADRSSFVVWLEGREEALVVAPTLPRRAESNGSIDLDHLLSLALG